MNKQCTGARYIYHAARVYLMFECVHENGYAVLQERSVVGIL
jgi:hypothetical protein